MPFVEVFTREQLSDDIRAQLAEELSNTMMTIEIRRSTESAKLIAWIWFHTVPTDSWAHDGAAERQSRRACTRILSVTRTFMPRQLGVLS